MCSFAFVSDGSPITMPVVIARSVAGIGLDRRDLGRLSKRECVAMITGPDLSGHRTVRCLLTLRSSPLHRFSRRQHQVSAPPRPGARGIDDTAACVES